MAHPSKSHAWWSSFPLFNWWSICTLFNNRNQNDCTVPGELSFFVCQRLTHWQSGFARTYARHVFAQRTIACFGNLHFWIKHVFFGNFKVGVWGHRLLWVLHLSPQVQDFSKSLHRKPPGQSQFYSEYFLLSLHITTLSVFVQIHLEACIGHPRYHPDVPSKWKVSMIAACFCFCVCQLGFRWAFAVLSQVGFSFRDSAAETVETRLLLSTGKPSLLTSLGP